MNESSTEDHLEEIVEDLEENDKRLLRNLVVTESFRVSDPLDKNRYRCVQSCVICNRLDTLGLEDTDSEDMKDITDSEIDCPLPIEKRKAIMKDVVHELFENKWKAERLVKCPNSKRCQLEFGQKKFIMDVSNDSTLAVPLRNEIKLDKPPLKDFQIIHEFNQIPEDSTDNKILQRELLRESKENETLIEKRLMTDAPISLSKPYYNTIQTDKQPIKDDLIILEVHEKPQLHSCTGNKIPQRAFYKKAKEMKSSKTDNEAHENSNHACRKRCKEIDYDNNKKRAYERLDDTGLITRRNETVSCIWSKKTIKVDSKEHVYVCNKCPELLKTPFLEIPSRNKCIVYKKRENVRMNNKYSHLYVSAKDIDITEKERDCQNLTPRHRLKRYHNKNSTSPEELQPPRPTYHAKSISFPNSYTEQKCRCCSKCYLQHKNNYINKYKRRKVEVEPLPLPDEKSLVVGVPVNDTDVTFRIDRDRVDVELYQDGLANKKWNPTQSLYEVCSQSQWLRPEFRQIDFVPDEGFLWSVRVQEHTFLGRCRGTTKRAARHLAAIECLRYLGFCFP